MASEQKPNVGHLITEKMFKDAIHVAVAPVVASTTIRPGEHVKLLPGGTAAWGIPEDGQTIGVADPFLREEIKVGETFWLFMYPDTVTGLRHSWTHPAFTAKIPGG